MAKVLDDFEHGESSRYEENHQFVSSYWLSLSKEQAKFGQNSLKLAYHFGGWRSGNGAMYIRFKESLVTKARPLKLGLWVFGDGHSPWLRATLLDGNGERKWVNLTKGNIDWEGWKYVETGIDPEWELPLQLEQLYAVEQNKELQGLKNYKGCVYFDQIRFVYKDIDDLIGPEFIDIQPNAAIIYKDNFTISASVIDSQSGVNPESIHMKINGKSVNFTYNQEKQRITYTLKGLSSGDYHVFIEASDHAGNCSLPCIDRIYTVDLSPDIEPPVLSNVSPTETAAERTSTPRVTFRISDQKSGVDPQSIRVLVNHDCLAVYYDTETGWGYALANELGSGEHTLEITARDQAGNGMEPFIGKFDVEQGPLLSKHSQAAIIPDTHSYDCGMKAFQLAYEQHPAFIIHMGDLVDLASKEEYERLSSIFTSMDRKIPIYTIPGNHEAFQGNLDLYRKRFGSPTYHFYYRGTLFVFLNSAFEQSITASDSTQFHYLQRLLNHQENRQVVIVTHVPTRDTFGTGHQMEQKDAEKLEAILGQYKEKWPAVSVTVLFGHLHVLQQWTKDGVDYTVTGNSASKGYVAVEKGNLSGQGLLTIAEDKLKYQFIPYQNTIYLEHDKVRNGCLRMCPGEKLQLQVTLASKGEKVNLNRYSAIIKRWRSDAENIARVHGTGEVEALASGSTSIHLEIGDQEYELPLEVSGD